MSKKKKTVAISIDEDLWQLAEIILPCSRSYFIEQSIRNYINSNNEIDELKKDIDELKKQIIVKEEKLKHMETIRETNTKNEELIKSAMQTVKGAIMANDCITKQQIKHIANRNNLNIEIFENMIKNKGYKIV